MTEHELDGDGRLDLYVYNEATAWTLCSRQLGRDAPLADDKPWDDAIAEGRLFAQMLYQDDAFHARIVLGELRAEEEEAWVGRASWWLEVPDGVLVLAAGGEFVWGWTGDSDYDEFVHPVRVPPGRYRVDVYTTLTGVNGLQALRRAGHDEALGAWWRRTRPDEAIPPWLQFYLLEGLAEDPGHESEWSGWSTARHHDLMHAAERDALIDWIVQLRPLEGKPPSELPELDEGCFYEPELRAPERCPRALVGDPFNAETESERAPREPVDVFERVSDLAPIPIEGGPVAIPTTDVELAARIAWFAWRGVEGEVLIDGPELGDWADAHLPADDLFLRTGPDRGLRLGFSENEAVHDLLLRLRRLGPAFAALPDGASLELVAAGEADEVFGKLRLAGTCRSDEWVIERAWPEVSAHALRGALTLAHEADGVSIAMRDAAELERMRERWREEGMQRRAPLVVDGLDVGHDEGGRFLLLVASAVFALRFGDTWPCPPPEDPLAGLDSDVEPEDFAELAEQLITLTDPLLEADSGRAYYDIDEDDIPEAVRQQTDSVLAELVDGGAFALGNVVCSLSPSVLMRAVAEGRARWFGVLMVAPFVGAVKEAYSRFADGSSLTTTTNASPGGSALGAEVHWNRLPEETSAEALVGAHLAAIERHASERGTSVELVRQNLLGFCEALEEFLVRRIG